MTGLGPGLDLPDLIHHVLALDDFSEDGVAIVLGTRSFVVEKLVVLRIDEELGGGFLMGS
jgi:hypothetical protein